MAISGLASNFKDPEKIIVGIVLLVVAMQILVSALPTLIVAFINISTISNLGFASFFSAGGVVLLILGVAILLGVLKALGIGGSGGKGRGRK